MKQRESYEDLLAENVALRSSVAELESSVAELESNAAESQSLLQRKEERIAYLERLLFGAKRDKLAQHGPGLFDKLFEEALDAKDLALAQTEKEIKDEAQKRRTSRKKETARPAKYHYSGLKEEWRTEYPEGINIQEYDEIGTDESRILHQVPARVWVECIKRPILRHKDDKKALSPRIVQAPSPKPVIGGNHVAADFLTMLIVNKYEYHIPEYRQVKMHADLGVKLPTSTINDWVHAVANKLYPLYETLCEEILLSDYLQIDEVPWKIADRPGKSCRYGYAWQFRDARENSKGTYFFYNKGSRAGEIPRSQLKDFKGAIQTDGYKVYDYFENKEGITSLGCMAHVRRKFIDAQKTHPMQAVKAVEYISLLYTLEENLRQSNTSIDKITLERRAKAIPIMDAMEAWMKVASMHCTPDDPLGRALDYAYKLWPRMRRYTEYGGYQIDNNAVERGQRPSVMGRKNYLFSKNDKGAEDNAVFYSLLQSCEIAGINKLEWLTNAINTIKEDPPDEDIKKLLPYYFKKPRD